MAHTPGPWHWFSDEDVIDNGKGSLEIALVVGLEYDGRLIAAAPDLLAALRALLDWGREHTSPRDDNSPHALLIQACEAVAKAEGRE